jgi:hypothetical protein
MTRRQDSNVVVSLANLVDDREVMRPHFRPRSLARALLFPLRREFLIR